MRSVRQRPPSPRLRAPRGILAALAAAAVLAPPAAGAQAAPPAGPDSSADLTELSLEELMNVEVTSVSRRAETISEAAAAIYVLTQEDLRRAGVTTIPEALRLVPGLQVARATANTWAISARGFNGRFANKLLVLIDGRSVYTPLFSGVFWDVQDTLLEDIERIEVIRGPGATLWGANAVNGVINIITKSARQTRGGLVTAAAGSEIDYLGGARYGAEAGRASWRVYAKAFERGPGARADGSDADDDWALARGGFRVDATLAEGDELTVQGDLYDGDSGERLTLVPLPALAPRTMALENRLSGGNLLARWSRALAGASHLTLQAYYDRSERDLPSILGETRDTFDLDFQHALTSDRHKLVWGLGVRRTRDRFDGSDFISLLPEERTDDLYSGFLQDEIALVPERVWLTVGTKVEENDYTGLEVQPSVRALWTPRPRQSLWAAVSRAVRTPSRAEADVRLVGDVLPPGALFPGAPPAIALFLGSADFGSEELLAYEAGYRVGLAAGLFLDVAAFYNDYDELRTSTAGEPSLVLAPVPHLVIPNVIDNRMAGETWGLEIAARWWVSDRWRLDAAYGFLEMDLEVAGEDPILSAEVLEGESPEQQLSLRSSWDVTAALELDLVGRYVGALPSQGVEEYVEADLRLGWRVRPGLTVTVVGRNLLDDRHREFVPEIIPTEPTTVERSVHAAATWTF
jgi:iron complex outermembrane receptor protein